MKRLDGREVAEYLQERHIRTVRGLRFVPGLAIVRTGDDAATTRYLAAKERYGEEIGVRVTVYGETAATIISRIERLSADPHTHGIIVQLPIDPVVSTDEALNAVSPAKDVDGLRADSPFQEATPKAVLWLLAAYNIDLKDKYIVVVGQGRLVGKPLADSLAASGHNVSRVDIDTPDLMTALKDADVIVSATGKPELITSIMIKQGAVVVDCGSPQSELAADVRVRKDLTITPNPGGVGPMTVAALFDNLLIALADAKR